MPDARQGSKLFMTRVILSFHLRTLADIGSNVGQSPTRPPLGAGSVLEI